LGVAVFEAALPAGGERCSGGSAVGLACSDLGQEWVEVGRIQGGVGEMGVEVGEGWGCVGLLRRCHDL
jgi:hypothetical protein